MLRSLAGPGGVPRHGVMPETWEARNLVLLNLHRHCLELVNRNMGHVQLLFYEALTLHVLLLDQGRHPYSARFHFAEGKSRCCE